MARRKQLPLRSFPLLILLNMIWIAFEGLGVGLLLPVFELLRAGGDVEVAELEGWHWDALRAAASFVGVGISLGLLLAVSFGLIVFRQVFKYVNTLVGGIVSRLTADRSRRRARSEHSFRSSFISEVW